MKVLVSDKVSQQGVEILQKEFAVDMKTGLTKEELISIIPGYDALVVRSETKVTKDVLAAAKNLKVIGRAGVGVDNIDVEAATQQGVIVLNAPEGNTIAATEHTCAMMLALARNVAKADASMRQKLWQRSKFMGVELRGKTLGILGLGRIGTGVAKRMLAMEMRVMAYDPFVNAEQAKQLGIEIAEIDDILAQADFLTLHLPLTPKTKNLLNAAAFAKMKKGVRIVNCARGGVIDEVALAQALEAGIVGGAAIDVFEQEPINQDNPLLDAPNTVLTPHLGASTEEAQVGVAVDVAKGIIAALRGEPVMTAVNMAAIPAHVMQTIRPYFNLAEKVGCLAAYLSHAPVKKVEVTYNGEIAQVDTKLLSTAVLKGLLNPVLQETVNYVNAPGLAKQRGITVKEVKAAESKAFANLLIVQVTTDKGDVVVEGTLFGQEERIVSINGYRVDVDPRGRLLLCPHINRPGVIGTVGTILGEERINIASMQVGRTEIDGTNLMALAVEADVPDHVLARIKAVEAIFDATLVNFNAR